MPAAELRLHAMVYDIKNAPLQEGSDSQGMLVSQHVLGFARSVVESNLMPLLIIYFCLFFTSTGL